MRKCRAPVYRCVCRCVRVRLRCAPVWHASRYSKEHPHGVLDGSYWGRDDILAHFMPRVRKKPQLFEANFISDKNKKKAGAGSEAS